MNGLKSVLSHYRIDLSIAGAVGLGILIFMGLDALIHYLVLGVLEISFSFDNAVVNAAVLATMTLVWQKRFITWGILIAVVGMRFLFPVLIVMVTAHLGFMEVINLAVFHPDTYALHLEEASPQVLTLGGTFLELIFLDFMFGKREITWLSWLERPLARVGKVDMLAPIITLTLLLIVSSALHNSTVLVYGVGSMVAYMIVNAIGNLFESEDEEEIEALEAMSEQDNAIEASEVQTEATQANLGTKINTTIAAGAASAAAAATVGKAGAGAFAYLEAQDASFSLDGVSGAFAVTSSIILIMLGLGVGALFVRSMTLHLLRSGALAEFRFLEAGAHWAIGVLAAFMFIKLFHEVPDYVTGLVGVLFIAAAIISSKLYDKRHPSVDNDTDTAVSDDTVVLQFPVNRNRA